MNPPKQNQPRGSHFLAVGLALSLTFAPAFGAASDADVIKQLQEENAALRRQLAALGATSPTTPGQPATAQPAPTSASPSSAPRSSSSAATASAPTSSASSTRVASDGETVLLSPFDVKSDRDFGYRKTNSTTATRIGMDIQHIPMSISVLSEDFIKDTGIRNIQDITRYTPSAAGDPRMAFKAPGNGATPSGNMTMRGFPVNNRLRNGLSRFSYYNMDTVDRIEIIRGPAAVFFGLGYPGGVVNYVSKQPSFVDIPSVFSYSYGGNSNKIGTQRAAMDVNRVLSKKAAFRVVGAWNDEVGTQRWEYERTHTFYPSLTLVPFDSGKLKINLEVENGKQRLNLDNNSWVWGNGWLDAYATPTADLIAASGVADATAYRARILNSFANYIADWRKAQGAGTGFDASNNYVGVPASIRSIQRGGYYSNASGQRVLDEKFTYRTRGSYVDQEDTTVAATVDFAPFSWLDARYNFTHNQASFEQLQGIWGPRADLTYNAGPSKRGDYQTSDTHQLDLHTKFEALHMKHEFLVGGLMDSSVQKYSGVLGNQFVYANMPGSDLRYPTPVPTGYPPLSVPAAGITSWGHQLHAVTNRTGKVLNSQELFQFYDPGIHISPDVGRITAIDRGLLDQYEPKRQEWYINYMLSLFKEKLHVSAGYRHIRIYDRDQRVNANPPWVTGFPNIAQNVSHPPLDYLYYGIGDGVSALPGSYYQGTLQNLSGESKMVALTYDITPTLTAYTSFSKTFLPNTGFKAIWDESATRVRLAGWGYTTSQTDAEIKRIIDAGANTTFANEEGLNIEAGLKSSLFDNKLSGTLAVFRLERTNEKLDDSQRQIDDPVNYTGPNKTGTFITGNGGLRWYSNSSKRRVEGAEFEVVWTPVRNYQAVVNGSWQWKANTIADPTIRNPNDPALTADQKRAASLAWHLAYDLRMPNVPEYRFNIFNKYTFTDGFAKGISATLGLRYSSKMNIVNNQDWDSSKGGLTAGDYVAFDGGVSYPWELFGYRVLSTFQVQNLLDKDFIEGGGGFRDQGALLAPPRTWLFVNSLQF